MTGLKTFRLVPFCLLLLAGNVFAAGNGTSAVDISGYAKVIQQTIQSRGAGVFDNDEGKQCVVSIHLARDGSLLGFNTEGGEPDFCNKVSDVMRGIKKFPTPPSDAVYQKIKNSYLDFKP
ncbi:cell envelope integrity protein TolA [Salmonella enterica]|nr:cell envelope integrity protein TolA [Salmonella enterica]EHI9911154.1 cell envelope integrity protein TolA [Salmonella enterica]EHJ0910480.1 cell envelope integrity protein TolA [Salmonella enterica]